MSPRLVLGSGSPRRFELLAQIGIVPDEVRPADINEDRHPGELPRPYVKRMAFEKAAAVSASHDDVVLTADTTVSLGRRILGKPGDEAEAIRFLYLLSGRRHRVTTAVAVRRGETTRSKLVETVVKMKRLSDQEVSGYVRSGEWRGKAGGYAIQGLGGAFIPFVSGNYSAVVGLPLTETLGLLEGVGFVRDQDGRAR